MTPSISSSELYSVHVPAGLPVQIMRAAHQSNMTPGEFLAHAVEAAASRSGVKPSVREDAASAARRPALANA